MRKLKKIPGLFLFIKEAKSIRGLPDLIVCYQGKFWGLELKRSIWELYYKKTGQIKLHGRTVLQYQVLKRLTAAQGCGIFVYPENESEVIDAIKRQRPLEIPLTIY